MRSAWSLLRPLLESSGLFGAHGGGDGPGGGGSDLRSRFMALADGVRDREALWDRIKSSMDEDEIEEYIEDLESRHGGVAEGEDWEVELDTIRRAWASGARVTYPRNGLRLGEQPHSAYVGDGIGDALITIAHHKVEELRNWSAHPQSDEDDALLAAMIAALSRVEGAVRNRMFAELEPVQVLGLTLGVRHLYPPGMSSDSDEAARHIGAILYDLVDRDIGRDDRHVRGFIPANDRYMDQP